MDGAVIRIHFPGWSPKHDRWLSLQSEWTNLAPMNLLSGRQRDTGGILSPEQATATYHYLLTGTLPLGIGIGSSDSEHSFTSSDAENSMLSGRSSSRGNMKENSLRCKSPQHCAEPVTRSRLAVGSKIEVQDLFRTKVDEGVKAKWRVAEITDMQQSTIRIHFIGWDHKWDEDIDLSREGHRIRDCVVDHKKGKAEPKQRKLKDPKKSFSQYDGSSKHLTPVQEVSERSSPSMPNSRIGTIALSNSLSSSGRSARGNTSCLAVGLNQSLDSLLENSNESAKSGYSQEDRHRQLPGYRSFSARSTGSAMSLEEKIRIAMQVADKNVRDYSALTSALSANKYPESVDEKVLQAVAATNSKYGRNATGGTSFIRSSFASETSTSTSVKVIANSRRPNVSDDMLKEKLEKIGLFVKKVVDDGNSLFRSVSHQMYLTEGRHLEIRELCVAHMLKHKKRFEMFCSCNFMQHLKDIAVAGFNGDELEIRALEEVLDRIFFVFRLGTSGADIEAVPLDINQEEIALLPSVEPIKIFCHWSGHYSSVVNQIEPAPLPLRTTVVLADYRAEAFEMSNAE